jgi:aldehyde dehydrogenase (NAD+)
VIIDEKIADKFVEALAARAGKVRVGNGLESGVDMGPAVDPSQLETDLKYIEIGRDEGKLVCGGSPLKDADRATATSSSRPCSTT